VDLFVNVDDLSCNVAGIVFLNVTDCAAGGLPATVSLSFALKTLTDSKLGPLLLFLKWLCLE
jgi:hypothetical protein